MTLDDIDKRIEATGNALIEVEYELDQAVLRDDVAEVISLREQHTKLQVELTSLSLEQDELYEAQDEEE